jgi:hypothetical protein
MKIPRKIRFYEKFVRDGNGCWIWESATQGEYGCFTEGPRVARKCKQAHRVSWELHNGPIPDDMCVCHKCDVKLCVNPDHLFLGTHSDNMQDRSKKGRYRGKGRQVLPADRQEMMKLSGTGLPVRVIAELTGFAPRTVRLHTRGK